jgi:hypothetical protein
MAQKVLVQLIDDIDGTVAVETVRFGLDGKNYAIDLSADNAQELRDSLAGFIESARRDTGKQAARPTSETSVTAGASSRQRTREIRAWARENGYPLKDRGRIAQDVVDAYEAAN